jgi:photosystem II stability/assembly factor-like uncharacterized protein
VLVAGQAPAEEGSGLNGIILRWDGGRWKRLLPRERENMMPQFGIWAMRGGGESMAQAFIVGQNSQLARFDGKNFGFRTPGTTAAIEAMWGDGEAWFAVSSGGDIFRRQSGGWEALESPTTYSLDALWGSGPSTLFAAGYGGTVLRRDGTRFVPIASGLPSEPSLYALWGSGPKDVFVAGERGAVAHFDGQRFTAQKTETGQSLYALWGAGPADVWAGGEAGTLLHFDGKSWLSVPSGTRESIFGLWGSGPSQVFAATASCSVLRWDGTAWKEVQRRAAGNCAEPGRDSLPRYFSRRAQIWGTTSATGGLRVYVLRDSGTLLVGDGQSWSEQAVGMTGLRSLWGSAASSASAPDTLFLGGADATILSGGAR